jgi:hypothetical protein
MNYPFRLEEISEWLKAKGSALKEAHVGCSVKETAAEATKPAAVADFFGRDAAGRVTGWVSGEFDFEVIRLADDATTWYQHVDVTALDELDPVFAGFEQQLRNPEDLVTGR